MVRVMLKHSVQVGRTLYAPGPQELDDALAEQVIGRGLADPAPAVAVTAARSDPEQRFAGLKATEAVEFIATCEDKAQLAECLTIEQRRKEPRKSVIEALGAKLFPPASE